MTVLRVFRNSSDAVAVILDDVFLPPFVRHVCGVLLLACSVFAQTPPPNSQKQPFVITLADAFARARQYGLQVQSADIVSRLAHEDLRQARAATLPSVGVLNEFLYTQGNGTPSGVYVANNGVHLYTEQVQVHEEVLALVRQGEVRLAAAGEAVARARTELARRSLNEIVVGDYYAVAGAVQKAVSAIRSLNEAKQFQDISERQERGGEVAHSDVIKAQLQVLQRTRELQDAELAVLKAKVQLGVLIFPTLQMDYDVEDDLAKLPALPSLPEITAQALATSPDLRAAELSVREARLGVSVARYGYLPTFSLDFFYGLNSNELAVKSYDVAGTSANNLPNEIVASRQNLGYSAQAALNFPLWTWGAIHSRVKQASLRAEQAGYDLAIAQRNVQATLEAGYREAQAALSQVDSLRRSNELSNESLRLTLLRYQAGEATALEVVDAQSTAALARNQYVDGLYRYRVALATLQNLTGNF
ncbi:MAG: TolC family protein [Bryobacteraceae bacterium]